MYLSDSERTWIQDYYFTDDDKTISDVPESPDGNPRCAAYSRDNSSTKLTAKELMAFREQFIAKIPGWAFGNPAELCNYRPVLGYNTGNAPAGNWIVAGSIAFQNQPVSAIPSWAFGASASPAHTLVGGDYRETSYDYANPQLNLWHPLYKDPVPITNPYFLSTSEEDSLMCYGDTTHNPSGNPLYDETEHQYLPILCPEQGKRDHNDFNDQVYKTNNHNVYAGSYRDNMDIDQPVQQGFVPSASLYANLAARALDYNDNHNSSSSSNNNDRYVDAASYLPVSLEATVQHISVTDRGGLLQRPSEPIDVDMYAFKASDRPTQNISQEEAVAEEHRANHSTAPVGRPRRSQAPKPVQKLAQQALEAVPTPGPINDQRSTTDYGVAIMPSSDINEDDEEDSEDTKSDSDDDWIP